MNSEMLLKTHENYCKVQPHHASLGYPLHNMAAHTEAMPTREGICHAHLSLRVTQSEL